MRLCESTGYDEVSVISLSTSDYSGIAPLLSEMADWTAERKINIALPSLRIDTFSEELVEKLNLKPGIFWSIKWEVPGEKERHRIGDIWCF